MRAKTDRQCAHNPQQR